MTTPHQAGLDAADMFDNVVAGVLTGILDDQTDRDVIALAQEFSVDGELRCVETHSPRRGLHEFAARREADVLVVGASRRDENDRTFLGDDTRKTLEDAPCAVAVAPHEFAARAGPIKKVGVGFDGPAQSGRALALARRLAAERRAELSAFEAVPAPVYARDPWNVEGDVAEHVEAARQRVAALDHLQAEAGFGDLVDELARYGQAVDLLVIGGHHHRPIDHLSEQSTAQRLADEVTTPLLVLPAGDTT